jgi:SAM-dependent methyltransferase
MHDKNIQQPEALPPQPELPERTGLRAWTERSLGWLGINLKPSDDEILPAAEVTEPEPVQPFRPDTIVHEMQPKGGRSLGMYESHLFFNRRELAGKKILDLGAGPEVKFAKGLHDAGIEADVTSLSPDFAKQKYADQAKAVFPEAKLAVGIGEDLPFEDQSFDRIFSFFTHIHVRDQRAYVKEMARVLANDGTATIGPVETGYKTFYDLITEDPDLKDYLAKQGMEAKKLAIPEEVFKSRAFDPFLKTSRVVPGFAIVLHKHVLPSTT